MASRPQSYYELLDIPPDAKREAIALGYQRALEALAQEHDADPGRRALLRKAFEVLTDPIQRMSYDLGTHPQQSAGRLSAQSSDDADLTTTQTLAARVWESTWGKVLIAALILVGVIMWAKSGKSSSADAPSAGAAQSSLSASNSTTSVGPINSVATAKSDTAARRWTSKRAAACGSNAPRAMIAAGRPA